LIYDVAIACLKEEMKRNKEGLANFDPEFHPPFRLVYQGDQTLFIDVS